jgi:stringent starvation protein B
LKCIGESFAGLAGGAPCFTAVWNMSDISTKPYMLRAIYEWCTDSGYTPYLAVKVDASTTVPMEYVKKGEIVLNISYGATSGLKMDNDAHPLPRPLRRRLARNLRPGAQRAGDLRQRKRPGHGVRAAGGGPPMHRAGRTAHRHRCWRPCQPCRHRPWQRRKPRRKRPDDDTDPPKKGGRPR